MSPATITAADMRRLLAEGRARPLLAGHFPVPVELDERWWHVPDTGGEAGDFVPAPAELAATFAQLAARRRAADAAVARAERGSTP
ncbi:hypothetical protein ACVGVM_29165 (plasmid) [Pseudonocardia bannensis]|uniref:Uncharacterized protein n=1 Tax=Pseudonocardia bannensis TaxID=630973 RepID=A0A848DM46_9PSEU|nr:hypothetical protein [Pseudonocardia bannensis]NMH93511.1 hypothetical protein [Pseudonocardia bannensis]